MATKIDVWSRQHCLSSGFNTFPLIWKILENKKNHCSFSNHFLWASLNWLIDWKIQDMQNYKCASFLLPPRGLLAVVTYTQWPWGCGLNQGWTAAWLIWAGWSISCSPSIRWEADRITVLVWPGFYLIVSVGWWENLHVGGCNYFKSGVWFLKHSLKIQLTVP
jgi:hypothetical protein